MSIKTINLSDELYSYLQAVSLREPEVLRTLRDKTLELSTFKMQIAPEQGQFMSLLIQLMGARKALEVGVYTGYSALSVALAMPDDGKVVACDVSEEWTDIAKPYWEKAGVAHKIDLRIAPALDTLDAMLASGEQETFDFAFIDADKANMTNYYEKALQLVRKGGLIAVDNVLWGGKVIDADAQEKNTQAIREFNDKLHQDERVSMSLVPIGDGVSLALKR